jgi:hypothetical protein
MECDVLRKIPSATKRSRQTLVEFLTFLNTLHSYKLEYSTTNKYVIN